MKGRAGDSQVPSLIIGGAIWCDRDQRTWGLAVQPSDLTILYRWRPGCSRANSELRGMGGREKTFKYLAWLKSD